MVTRRSRFSARRLPARGRRQRGSRPRVARSLAWMGSWTTRPPSTWLAPRCRPQKDARSTASTSRGWRLPRELAASTACPPTRLPPSSAISGASGRAGAQARWQPASGASPALGLRKPALPRPRSGPADGIQGSLIPTTACRAPRMARVRWMTTTTPNRRDRVAIGRPSASSITARSCTCATGTPSTCSAAPPTH